MLPGFKGADVSDVVLGQDGTMLSGSWDSSLNLLRLQTASGLGVGRYNVSVDVSNNISLPVYGMAANDPGLRIGARPFEGWKIVWSFIGESPYVASLPPVVTAVEPGVETMAPSADGVSGARFPAGAFTTSVSVSIGLSAVNTSATPGDSSLN